MCICGISYLLLQTKKLISDKKISNCAQEMWTIFYLSCLDLWNFYSAQSCIEVEILCGFICHCFYMYNVHNYIVHFSLVHYYTHYSTFAIVTKVPGFNHVHGSRIFQPWLNVPGVLSIYLVLLYLVPRKGG